MQKKILIIGSSCSLPRPDGVYEKTWPFLLKVAYPDYDIITLARRRNNTRSLQGGTGKAWAYGDSLHFYHPDIVVMQIGISDCFPRYLRASSLLNKLIERCPSWIQTIFWKCYKLFFHRNVKRADVPYAEFCHNIRQYMEECRAEQVAKVVIVLIYTPPEWLRKRIPTLMGAIDLYNRAYQKIAEDYGFVVTVHPLQEGKDEYVLPDGIHSTDLGHQLIFEAINAEIPL